MFSLIILIDNIEMISCSGSEGVQPGSWSVPELAIVLEVSLNFGQVHVLAIK